MIEMARPALGAAALAGCSALPESTGERPPDRRRAEPDAHRAAAAQPADRAVPRPARPDGRAVHRRCPTATSTRAARSSARVQLASLPSDTSHARRHQPRPGDLRGQPGVHRLGALRRRPRGAADPRLAGAQHRDVGQLFVPQRRRLGPPLGACDRRGDRHLGLRARGRAADHGQDRLERRHRRASASSCAWSSRAPASASTPCSGPNYNSAHHDHLHLEGVIGTKSYCR